MRCVNSLERNFFFFSSFRWLSNSPAYSSKAVIDQRQSLWDWKINRPKHVTRALHFNVYWLLAEHGKPRRRKKRSMNKLYVLSEPHSLFFDLCMSFGGTFSPSVLHTPFNFLVRYTYFSPFSTQFPSIVMCVACFCTKVKACNWGTYVVSWTVYYWRHWLSIPLPAAFSATSHAPQLTFPTQDFTTTCSYALISSSTTTESVCKQ